MSPLVAYHVTRTACRDSIQEYGLLPNRLPGRPYGVYVFRGDDSFDHLGWNSTCVWHDSPASDLWEVTYIGPLMPDRYVLNAMILLGVVDHVHLMPPWRFTSNR